MLHQMMRKPRFCTRVRTRFGRSGACQVVFVFSMCWIFVAWKNLRHVEDDRPEIRALERDVTVENLPGFVTSQPGNGSRTVGLVLEFFGVKNEDNKPNLHNLRYLLRDVLGYEVVKCPTQAASVKDCQIPPAFQGNCWKFLWVFGGNPKSKQKILSSLETCPGAAIPFYPEIDAALVGRKTFAGFRNIPNVARSFEYPKQVEDASEALRGDLYVVVKTPAHRGKGVHVIPRSDKLPEMMWYLAANDDKSNTTSRKLKNFKKSLPPWKKVWADRIFNPKNTAEAKQFVDSPFIVQEFMDKPLLLHGRFFDVGVFVLLVSVNPIRLFLYDDDVVVKVAAKEYPVPFDHNKDTDGYVLSDTNNVFLTDLPEIQSRMAVMNNGSTNASVVIPTEKQLLKDYFATKLGNGTRIFRNSWLTIKRVLMDVFSQQEEAIAWHMGRSWGKRAAVDEDSSGEEGKVMDVGELPPETLVFQLFRADFLFNASGHPFLTEINGMPQFMKNRRLSVLHEMLQLIGLDTGVCEGKVFEKKLGKLCPEDCSNNLDWCSRAKCRNSCYKCLPMPLKIQARRFHCENVVAKKYERLLPARDRTVFVNFQKSRLTTVANEWMFDWQDQHYPEFVPPVRVKKRKARKSTTKGDPRH